MIFNLSMPKWPAQAPFSFLPKHRLRFFKQPNSLVKGDQKSQS